MRKCAVCRIRAARPGRTSRTYPELFGPYVEMKTTLYEALGISQFASDEEVRAALRGSIRKYYAKTRDGHGNVEEALRFVNHASRILSDPALRAQYDYDLKISAGSVDHK